MGNRAVITSYKQLNKIGEDIGIYVHWNGGPESVEAFCAYCDMKGFRDVDTDQSYAYARLAQVYANFFEGGLSVGVNRLSNLDCDNGDNGVYYLKGWNVVTNSYLIPLYYDGTPEKNSELVESLKEINKYQPENLKVKDEDIESYVKNRALRGSEPADYSNKTSIY